MFAMTLVEGVASVWHYHLSYDGKRAACDAALMVMPTKVPLSTWGMPGGHIPSSYCKSCAALAQRAVEIQ